MNEKSVLNKVLRFSQNLADDLKDCGYVSGSSCLENGHDVSVVSETLISTDSLVNGVDFSYAYTDYYSIGFKAIQSAIADIYTAGGKPIGCLVSLIADLIHLEVNLPSLYDGIFDSLKLQQALLLGGDTSDSAIPKDLSICVTAVGKTATSAPKYLTRTVPEGEFDLYVSAPIGLSLLGFCLINELTDYQRQKSITVSLRDYPAWLPTAAWLKYANLGPNNENLVNACVEIFLRPLACNNRESSKLVAATDISDGLMVDLAKFYIPSEHSIYLDLKSIISRISNYEPIAAYFGLSLQELVLYSGEEYKHLVVAPKDTSLDNYIRIGEISRNSKLTPLSVFSKEDEWFNHGSSNIYSRFFKAS